MFQILVVEDDNELRDLFCAVLTENGYTAVPAVDGIEAFDILDETYVDLIISDIMMPRMDGFELIKALREAHYNTPVLMITARSGAADKREGFRIGTDDYMVKPFLPQELLFRVKAILRRSYKSENPLVKLKHSEIDFARAEVIKDDCHIPLTAKEYELLSALYRNAGRIVTIDALCEAAWGDNPFGYENSLMAHIRRIREKIEQNPSQPVSLVTFKGLGYKLIVEER